MTGILTFNTEDKGVDLNFLKYHRNLCDGIVVVDLVGDYNKLDDEYIIGTEGYNADIDGAVSFFNDHWRDVKSLFNQVVIVMSDEILYSKSLSAFLSMNKHHTTIDVYGFDYIVDDDSSYDELFSQYNEVSINGDVTRPAIVNFDNLFKISFGSGFNYVDTIKPKNHATPRRDYSNYVGSPVKLLKMRSKSYNEYIKNAPLKIF